MLHSTGASGKVELNDKGDRIGAYSINNIVNGDVVHAGYIDVDGNFQFTPNTPIIWRQVYFMFVF